MTSRYVSMEMSTYQPLASSEIPDQRSKGAFATEYPIYETPVSKGRRIIRHATTWKGTASIGIAISGLAFLLNLLVLVWALVALPKRNGFAIAFTGSQSATHAIELAVKLVINVISTLILISSCRCTQYLCAPTREDIDRCHVNGQWLDIGIRSFRNFKMIRSWRRWLVIALFITSIPIHFIYNSTILTTLGVRDYVAVTVDDSFTSGLTWNSTVTLPKLNETTRQSLYSAALSLQEKAKAGTLVAMDTVTCHSTYYRSTANTQWGDVLLVSPELEQTPNKGGNTSTVAAFLQGRVPSPGAYHTYDWSVNFQLSLWDDAWDQNAWQAAAADCILDTNISCASNSSFSAVPVGNCLAEKVPETCTVSINLAFLIVVLVSNAVKAGSLLFCWRKSDFTPLVTTGDAIASFLILPDPCTAGLGPVSVLEVSRNELHAELTTPGRSISGRQYRWFQAPAKWRWYLGTLSMLIPFGLGGFCLYWDLAGTGAPSSQSLSNPSLVVEEDGFFNSGASVITFAHSFAGMALTVNAAQLLLTSIYFCVNDLLTSMTLAHEYHSYAVERKPLRVTRSQGQQRSTYFLSMPNKYSIPLIAAWTLLHWAIAAEISLTRVDIYTRDGVLDAARSYTGMVVSSDWLWETLAASLFVTLGLILLGIRKLKKGMPLTRTCSLAISAACHRSPREDPNIVFAPLQYGVLQGEDGLKCVGFSAEHVTPLIPGCTYVSYRRPGKGGDSFSRGD